MESWKVIPSEPELEVSSLGRVRVIPHTVSMPYGGVRIYGGTPTTGQWDGTRFIYARKGHKTLKVARLVCEAFNGPPTPDAPYCLHKDETSCNNVPNNLKWGTQEENLNCPKFLAYCAARTGDNSPYRKGMHS